MAQPNKMSGVVHRLPSLIFFMYNVKESVSPTSVAIACRKKVHMSKHIKHKEARPTAYLIMYVIRSEESNLYVNSHETFRMIQVGG